MPDVIFNIVADSSQLESTITLLEKLGQVDKKTAEQFRAATEEYKKSSAIVAQATQAQVGASEKFAQGAKGIDLLSKALKDLGIAIPKDQLKQFAEGVLLGLEDAMVDAGVATKTTTKTLDDLKKAVSSSGGKSFLGATLDQASNITKTNNGLQSLKARLLEAKAEAQKLGIEFGFDSKQAVAAQVAVGKLDGELQQFNERVKSFNPENKFAAVSAAFQGIAGSIAIASGTLTLFGADAEEAEAITKKLDAALKLTAGLSAITQLGGDFKNLGLALGVLQPQIVKTTVANVALTESEIAAGAGGEVAAAGTETFNTALKASPLGIFLVVLTAAAAAYLLLSDSATDAEKAQEKLNIEMQKGVENSQQEVQQVKVLVEEYKASNTTKERQAEILKILNESYPSYFNNLSVEKTSIEDLNLAYEKLVTALVLKSQLDAIIDAAAENRNQAEKERNQKDSEGVLIANKLAASLLGAKAFETQADKVKKLDAEYKTLIETAGKLSKTLDETGGDPAKKSEKPEKPRVAAVKKQLEDEAKIIEALRKKELAQDLENLKVYVAARKEAITNSNTTEEQKEKDRTSLQLAELNLRLLYYQQYGEDVGDVLNQIAELNAKIRKDAEQKVDIHPNADDFKDQEDALKKANDAIIELNKQRNEILIQAGLELVDGLFAITQVGFENEISELQKKADFESSLREKALSENQTSFDKREITAKQFRATEEKLLREKVAGEKSAQAQINEVKRKADVANRLQKLFEIGVATARNIVENPALSIFYALLGASQAAIVLATPIPKYHSGRLGSNNSMEEHAIIRKDETVVNPQNSKDYYSPLKAIHNRSIPPEAFNDFVKSYTVKTMPTFSQVTTTNYKPQEIDYDKLAKSVAWEMRNSSNVNIKNWKPLIDVLKTDNDVRRVRS